MSLKPSTLRPHEILGLLASADRETVERRAEALGALLKLGLSPPEGDAIALPPDIERTPDAVAEAARQLRDPQKWLKESVLWPDGLAAEQAMKSAANLLQGTTGKPAEPAALVRQLAHQYLTDEVNQHNPTDQPDRWISRRLNPPAHPPLFLGTPKSGAEGSEGS